ncbi:MAG TPA: multiubiquitin domain-containing protein [Pseudoxanthomonas sp.]
MNATPDTHKPDKHTNIQIDRVHYKVEGNRLTGQQLRDLPTPPITADRDLFLVVPGAQDRKIGADEKVELHDGMRFFTAPGHINPGSMA